MSNRHYYDFGDIPLSHNEEQKWNQLPESMRTSMKKLPPTLLATHLVFQRLHWALLHNFGRRTDTYIALISDVPPGELAANALYWANSVAIVMGVFEQIPSPPSRRVTHHIGIHRLPWRVPAFPTSLAVPLHGFAVWALGARNPTANQVAAVQTEPADIMISILADKFRQGFPQDEATGHGSRAASPMNPVMYLQNQMSYNYRWSLQRQEASLWGGKVAHENNSAVERHTAAQKTTGFADEFEPHRFVVRFGGSYFPDDRLSQIAQSLGSSLPRSSKNLSLEVWGGDSWVAVSPKTMMIPRSAPPFQELLQLFHQKQKSYPQLTLEKPVGCGSFVLSFLSQRCDPYATTSQERSKEILKALKETSGGAVHGLSPETQLDFFMDMGHPRGGSRARLTDPENNRLFVGNARLWLWPVRWDNEYVVGVVAQGRDTTSYLDGSKKWRQIRVEVVGLMSIQQYERQRHLLFYTEGDAANSDSIGDFLHGGPTTGSSSNKSVELLVSYEVNRKEIVGSAEVTRWREETKKYLSQAFGGTRAGVAVEDGTKVLEIQGEAVRKIFEREVLGVGERIWGSTI